MSLYKIEYVCDDCENNVIIVVSEEQVGELKYCPICSCDLDFEQENENEWYSIDTRQIEGS